MDQFPKIAEQNPVPALTATMRADAVRAVGGYAEWLWVCDDYHLYMKLAQAGWRFDYVDRKLPPTAGRSRHAGQSYDRPKAEVDELKMFLGLRAAPPADAGARGARRARGCATSSTGDCALGVGDLGARGPHWDADAVLARGAGRYRRAVCSVSASCA